jgi:hypothetical protein
MAAKFNELYTTKITYNNFYYQKQVKKNNNRQTQFIGRNKWFISDNQISMLQNHLTQKMQRQIQNSIKHKQTN